MGATCQLTSSEGELYVVSGPAFIVSDLKRILNVLVFTHLWKVCCSRRVFDQVGVCQKLMITPVAR